MIISTMLIYMFFNLLKHTQNYLKISILQNLFCQVIVQISSYKQKVVLQYVCCIVSLSFIRDKALCFQSYLFPFHSLWFYPPFIARHLDKPILISNLDKRNPTYCQEFVLLPVSSEILNTIPFQDFGINTSYQGTASYGIWIHRVSKELCCDVRCISMQVSLLTVGSSDFVARARTRFFASIPR